MTCQYCLAKEATIHYRSNINGQISEQHLCAACAQDIEGGLFAHALAGPMEMLLGGGFFAPSRGAGRPLCDPCNTPPLVGDTCPSVPAFEADDTLKQRRTINALRQEMQTAIEAEQFERAAEIRDEIHRLESEM
ncbi:MAG: UvrB/UvrC motif-containing protein [Oscillospiraceae bacterium]|nr:UvrB/UvrC motif-containing protein [Oscillospiraceae bacterium]